MNVETLDALTERLRSEHWQTVTERRRLTLPPTDALLLVEVTPYGTVTDRYGPPTTHYASTFTTELVDVSQESLLWRWERVTDLLSGWWPPVVGAAMGRVVPFTAPHLNTPDDRLPGVDWWSVTQVWELSGDRLPA